jgi:hypothetical protein
MKCPPKLIVTAVPTTVRLTRHQPRPSALVQRGKGEFSPSQAPNRRESDFAAQLLHLGLSLHE